MVTLITLTRAYFLQCIHALTIVVCFFKKKNKGLIFILFFLLYMLFFYCCVLLSSTFKLHVHDAYYLFIKLFGDLHSFLTQ